jgi:siroheme decarboxylase
MNEATRKKLFERIQSDFPVERRPFRVLAEELGLSEDQILSQVRDWFEDGLIRQLGPVFEPRKLGYISILVASRVPEAEMPTLLDRLAAMNGVTHVYGREHEYNLWFTLSVQDEGPEPFAESLRGLREIAPNAEFHLLPAEKVYKIRVQFAGE